ncbi:MAG TPA: PAS domain-containing sensor histidine kinase [Ignavibacteriales bacterium]|nr:PAS domain-containing sensor histidine kinase [Ignavibacteriales bacterium]
MGKQEQEVKNYFKRIERLKESILTLNFADIPLELKKFPYDEIFERIPLPIFALDKNLNFTYCNNKIFDVSLFLPDELIDRHLQKLFDKQELLVIERELYDLMRKGLPKIRISSKLTRQDGSRVPVIIYLNTVIIENKIREIVGTIIDLSDIAQNNGKKSSPENIYKESCIRLHENISNAYYFSIDQNFIVKYAGESFQRISESVFGRKIKQGMNFAGAIADENRKEIWNKLIRKALNGENAAEGIKVEIDGVIREYEVFVIPVKNADEIAGASIALKYTNEKTETQNNALNYMEELESSKFLLEQKANELAKLNVKLLESESALKQSNQNKDKFFSIISHDLRNPLHALLSATELLADEVESLEQDEIVLFATSINKSAKNMFSLIENLLQWSRIQLGKLKPVFTKVNLYETASQTINYLTGAAQAKKIQLKNEIDRKIYVLADPNMLNSIIQNLMSNSIKFTNSEGEVKINARISGSDIIVTVSDTGIGMDKDDLENLFKLQNLTSRQGTANEKGTGLGLIICKELVEINKGEIWAESEPEKGSSFYIKLNKYPDAV